MNDFGHIVYSMTADGSAVYLGDANVNAVNGIWKVPAAGGSPIAIDLGQETAGLAVHGANLYWSTLFNNMIRDAPTNLVGGAKTITMSLPTSFLNTVAVDDTYVYVTSHNGDGYLARVDQTSGAVTILHQTSGAPYGGVAIDDTYAFFYAAPNVMRVNKDGTNPMTLVNDAVIVGIDATYVYFATKTGIGRVLKTGGAPGQLTTKANQNNIHGFVVDDMRMYFRNNMTGDIFEAISDGSGVLATLAEGQIYDDQGSGAVAFTADAAYVYWLGPNGWLYRTPK